MNRNKRYLLTCFAIIFAFAMGNPTLAQNNSASSYPNRPIKVIIGFTAGGPTDVIARVLAKEMTANLGQPVIVENIAGANSMIATNAALHAPPDGYTLFCASLHFNVNPILKKNIYRPLQDFVAIEQVANLPMVMVTSHSRCTKPSERGELRHFRQRQLWSPYGRIICGRSPFTND